VKLVPSGIEIGGEMDACVFVANVLYEPAHRKKVLVLAGTVTEQTIFIYIGSHLEDEPIDASR
jgi:hypothetical protein